MSSFSTSIYTAEQVLVAFRQRFIEEVDADAIVMNLKYYNILGDGQQKRITQTDGGRQKNQFLHDFLLGSCTKEAMLKVCDEMINTQGNPKMNKLGKEMKSALEKGERCVREHRCDTLCLSNVVECLGCMQVRKYLCMN